VERGGGEGGIAAPANAGLPFGLSLRSSELAFGSVRTLLSGSNPLLAITRPLYGLICVVSGGEGGIAAPANAGLPFGLSLCSSELAFGSVRTLLSGSNPLLAITRLLYGLICVVNGGEGGIRTLEGPIRPLTVFETAAFDHSATSPRNSIVQPKNRLRPVYDRAVLYGPRRDGRCLRISELACGSVRTLEGPIRPLTVFETAALTARLAALALRWRYGSLRSRCELRIELATLGSTTLPPLRETQLYSPAIDSGRSATGRRLYSSRCNPASHIANPHHNDYNTARTVQHLANPHAGLAQVVEHLICNQRVGSSNLSAGTNL
jgi:hypothetical protein